LNDQNGEDIVEQIDISIDLNEDMNIEDLQNLA
jgi:hypothetical protein